MARPFPCILAALLFLFLTVVREVDALHKLPTPLARSEKRLAVQVEENVAAALPADREPAVEVAGKYTGTDIENIPGSSNQVLSITSGANLKRHSDGHMTKLTYHDCDMAAGKSELPVYRIIANSSSTQIDRSQCVRKRDLDFVPSASWILLTVADANYFAHCHEMIRSLLRVPQKGGLPKKIVVVDIGMNAEQAEEMRSLTKEGTDVSITVDDRRDLFKKFRQFSQTPQVLRSMGYPGQDENRGVAYRVKAVAVGDWFKRLLTEGVDQLVAVDAGGVFLSSAHRPRNFAALEGFYGGFTSTAILSALVDDSGWAPTSVRRQRYAILKENKILPQCFDYESDFQVDASTEEGFNEFSSDKKEMQHGFHDSKMLKTIEGGYLIFDQRHAWVRTLIENYSRIMTSDKLWTYSQGFYFPHDQKILGNELWKASICGSTPRELHLLDTDNVRFGSVVQKFPQRHHDPQMEKFPWAGYAYAFCGLKEGDYLRHPCVTPKSYPLEGGWEPFAAIGHAQ